MQLKPQNSVIFTVYSQTKKYLEMISTSHSEKLKHATIYLCVFTQILFTRIIFCIVAHVSFSVNKSNFHFKRKSSISILQFNNVNFQIKQFVIFQKFSWNSVQPIWDIIMNLIEITYTELSIYLYWIIRKFPRIRRLSFFIAENKKKSLTQK